MTRLETVIAGLGTAALIALGLWAVFSPEDKPIGPPVVTEQPGPVVVPITPPSPDVPNTGEPSTGQPEPVVPQEETTTPVPVPPVVVQPKPQEKPVVKPHKKKPVKKHKCHCKKKHCKIKWPKPDERHYFYAY